MRFVKNESVLYLTALFIKFNSQIMSSNSCSSLSAAYVKGVGGGYEGYVGNWGIDQDLCKVHGESKNVDFILQRSWFMLRNYYKISCLFDDLSC